MATPAAFLRAVRKTRLSSRCFSISRAIKESITSPSDVRAAELGEMVSETFAVRSFTVLQLTRINIAAVKARKDFFVHTTLAPRVSSDKFPYYVE